MPRRSYYYYYYLLLLLFFIATTTTAAAAAAAATTTTTTTIDAGELYGVVLCCRPANRHISANVGGRNRRATSMSVGGFQESTKQHRWSRLFQRQSRFQETALTGDVQEATDKSIGSRSAPAAGQPPADRGDRQQVLGCWPQSTANVEFQVSLT